jgi:hypothetical protein
MTTNSDKYNTLETALIDAIVAMREEISGLEDPPSYLNFNIEVDGRVLDGDIEVKFIFEGGNYSQVTKGGNLVNVVNEYLRRYGWNKRNDALCLPKVYDDERRQHTDN